MLVRIVCPILIILSFYFVQCEVDLLWTPDSHTVYVYENVTRTFNDTEKYCESLNGTIPSIDNNSTNQIIKTFIKNGVWIGFKETTSLSRVFNKLNGSPMNFSNWNDGQPDDICNEGCCSILYDGGWYDVECSDKWYPLCSINPLDIDVDAFSIAIGSNQTSRASSILMLLRTDENNRTIQQGKNMTESMESIIESAVEPIVIDRIKHLESRMNNITMVLGILEERILDLESILKKGNISAILTNLVSTVDDMRNQQGYFDMPLNVSNYNMSTP